MIKFQWHITDPNIYIYTVYDKKVLEGIETTWKEEAVHLGPQWTDLMWAWGWEAFCLESCVLFQESVRERRSLPQEEVAGGGGVAALRREEVRALETFRNWLLGKAELCSRGASREGHKKNIGEWTTRDQEPRGKEMPALKATCRGFWEFSLSYDGNFHLGGLKFPTQGLYNHAPITSPPQFECRLMWMLDRPYWSLCLTSTRVPFHTAPANRIPVVLPLCFLSLSLSLISIALTMRCIIWLWTES